MKSALKTSRTWSRLLPGVLALAALGLAIPAAQAQTAYVDSFQTLVTPLGQLISKPAALWQ